MDDDLMLNFAPAAPQAVSKRAKAQAKGQARKPSSSSLAVPAAAAAPSASTSSAGVADQAANTSTSRAQSSSASSSQPQQASTQSRRNHPGLTSTSSQQSRPRPQNGTASSSSSGAVAEPSKAKATTFISSLFSGTSQVTVDEDVNNAAQRKKAKPTNAPTDASTFEGLGVDPLLVAHLKSKRMNIGNRPTSIQRIGLPNLINGDDDRDVLLHSQTGSGKTLTYLLPVFQSLLPLCTETWIDRSVGTQAIILAPTRELARQIYEVAEKLCQLHLSLKEAEEEAKEAGEDGPEEGSIRRTRWLVPGLLSGGSTKNHEKSKLRKGVPILVATPGRLLDHLQNTSSFDVGKCRWLILDEADRLLEMGFKETLEGILKAMDGRRRLAFNTAKETLQEQRGTMEDIPAEEVDDGTGVYWWARPRKVVLCSATLDENVQMLAGTTLRKPQVLRGGDDLPLPRLSTDEAAAPDGAQPNGEAQSKSNASYTRLAAPAQLRQHAVVTPAKLRLVTLIALLRSALSRANATANGDARRVIVFMSCTDSVEFYWNALGGVKMEASDEADEGAQAGEKTKTVAKSCDLFPDAPIYRLHGSLAQVDRIASLKGFSSRVGNGKNDAKRGSDHGAILLCTSVAARGLDLPSVGCVIQLDPPTEGGPDEYLHRIGRTARVGRQGESWIMFLPHERDARTRLEQAMQKSSSDDGPAASADAVVAKSSTTISELSYDAILKRGFGGKGDEYESRATEVQLAFERWVLSASSSSSSSSSSSFSPLELARKAFLSHIRAYATHPSDEKDLFHVRFLHLGHLAKSFALREAPAMIKNQARLSGAAVTTKKQPQPRDVNGKERKGKRQRLEGAVDLSTASLAVTDVLDNGEEAGLDGPASAAKPSKRSRRADFDGVATASTNAKAQTSAEARMYAKVRELSRMHRVNGKLAAFGGLDEFQIG